MPPAAAVPAAVPLVLRPAGEDDLATIADLARRTWWTHYPGILTDAQIEYMLGRGYSREALLALLARPLAGMAIAHAPEPAGFAAWHAADSAATLKLDKLYVLPQHQGRGVGRALVEHVVGRARDAGCAALVLNVNRNNTASIRAYQRFGFVIRDAGDFPIGNGFVMEDYIMARPLDLPATP
jgi:ribosomal protein S18 acetylase RimI-like enzyme